MRADAVERDQYLAKRGFSEPWLEVLDRRAFEQSRLPQQSVEPCRHGGVRIIRDQIFLGANIPLNEGISHASLSISTIYAKNSDPSCDVIRVLTRGNAREAT